MCNISDEVRERLDEMCYDDGIVFLVNDKYICQLSPDMYEKKAAEVCWSPVQGDSNCPRLSCQCDLVVINDEDRKEELVGMMTKDRDVDLAHPDSFTLYVKGKEAENWELSTNVVSIKLLVVR